MRSESRCQVRPLSGVDECHVLTGREVPLRVGAKTERQTPRRVRHSASDRTPERTHRVVERVDGILERVDRILKGSLGQARVRRTCGHGTAWNLMELTNHQGPQRTSENIRESTEPKRIVENVKETLKVISNILELLSTPPFSQRSFEVLRDPQKNLREPERTLDNL